MAKNFPFFGNSYYIINGTIINGIGYWIKTTYNKTFSYSVDRNGNNKISSNSHNHGIRPAIKIKKSLLTTGTGVVYLTDIVKNGEKIFYNIDVTLYDGIKYDSLQGMTVKDDKLIFMFENRKNENKSVMYS